jgi:hypothetical protein
MLSAAMMAAAMATTLAPPPPVRNRDGPREPEIDMRDVQGSRQRKRWLERQARKRQRQSNR